MSHSQRGAVVLTPILTVLKKEPKDIEALRCKVVCLMKLDKCKEAYHVMTTDKVSF